MRILLLLLFFWSGAVFAQSYPDHQSTTVNDYAELLSAADKAALSSRLEQLRRDTGVEMTVLTLATQSDFPPHRSLERFATGVFNYWGVGDASRNDGVLVMILRDDRAMRIELGAAYAREWDCVAAEVVDEHFLSAFAAGDYPRGIKEGSGAVISEIIEPFLAGEEAPRSVSNEIWMFGVFAALFFAFTGRQTIGDALARFRTCPNCGHRGLRQWRSTYLAATSTTAGSGTLHVRCTQCSYESETSYVIPRRSSKSSSGFGGGSSGGGGASGRW